MINNFSLHQSEQTNVTHFRYSDSHNVIRAVHTHDTKEHTERKENEFRKVNLGKVSNFKNKAVFADFVVKNH